MNTANPSPPPSASASFIFQPSYLQDKKTISPDVPLSPRKEERDEIKKSLEWGSQSEERKKTPPVMTSDLPKNKYQWEFGISLRTFSVRFPRPRTQ
jgi:hypothetical protein